MRSNRVRGGPRPGFPGAQPEGVDGGSDHRVAPAVSVCHAPRSHGRAHPNLASWPSREQLGCHSARLYQGWFVVQGECRGPRRAVSLGFDNSGNRAPGRPRTAGEIEALVVGMAEENRDWGYRRIQGAWSNLGHNLARSTIAAILLWHGMEPAPERSRKTTWKEFLRRHWELIVAADFFTVEVWTPRGLQRSSCCSSSSYRPARGSRTQWGSPSNVLSLGRCRAAEGLSQSRS